MSLSVVLLFVAISVLVIASAFILDKLYGAYGLVALSIAIIFISNMIVLKRFDISPDRSLTYSVLIYPWIFIIASYTTRKYGVEIAKKGAGLAIISYILYVIINTLATFAQASEAKNVVDSVFGIIVKGQVVPGLVLLTVGSITALTLSLKMNELMFKVLGEKMNFKVATILSALSGDIVDSIVFVIIGLAISGFLPWNSVATEIVFMIVAKTIVSTINTLVLPAGEEKAQDNENEEKETSKENINEK